MGGAPGAWGYGSAPPPGFAASAAPTSEVVAHRHVGVARHAEVGGLDVAHAGELLAFGHVQLVGGVAHAGADLPGVLRRVPHAVEADQGVSALAEVVAVVDRQPGAAAVGDVAADGDRA